MSRKPLSRIAGEGAERSEAGEGRGCGVKGERPMPYEFYYWAGIQGRGEFVRLALEQAEAEYVDVARQAGGEAEMMRLLGDADAGHLPFAPPFLKAGELIIAQTANILFFLGAHHG